MFNMLLVLVLSSDLLSTSTTLFTIIIFEDIGIIINCQMHFTFFSILRTSTVTVPAKAGEIRSGDANDNERNNFEIFIASYRDRLLMSLLFAEAQPIPVHAMAAMIAIILGAAQFYMKKGGVIHKLF